MLSTDTSPNDVTLYVNWVLHAIFGLTAEADAIVRFSPRAIHRVARTLRMQSPIETRPLYRGVLLEDATTLGPDERMTWLSWSEDRDVARWFGSPASYISGPFHDVFPEAQGFVLTLEQPKVQVLWHHSWRRIFGPPLEALALRHPSMGQRGYQQIGWSLDTQHEVITAPLTSFPTPEPTDAIPGPSIDELDRRLTPNWIS